MSMAGNDREELIYDWNTVGTPRRPPYPVELDDETLRDGLQSPSVTTPTIEEKKRILHLMDDLGIDTADIGLPGAGKEVTKDTLELAMEIVRSHLKIAANCAARTVESDVIPIAEISQKAGMPVEASLFIGSSPIRQYAEDWTMERMLEHTRKAVAFAVGQGLPVMFVTEDTTRARPDDLRKLYLTAVDLGAKRICLADTVGHATPEGAFNLIQFIRRMLDEAGRPDVKVDWHGHNDRGLSIWNAIAALLAGANRVHACALGIGERVGNAPMDQLLVNLKLLGYIDRDLSKLGEYCRTVSDAVKVPIPSGYPVLGSDAFETGTGVHAAAVIKAFKKGNAWLADRVYSSVPASEFGLRQKIRIGPMSGKSNILFWLQEHGHDAGDAVVNRIFEAAKRSKKLLDDREIEALLK